MVQPTRNTRRRSASAQTLSSGAVHTLRLSDPGVREEVDAMMRELTATPEKARAFLISAGLLTRTGRVPKRFGG